MTISVFLLDDHEIVRRGIAAAAGGRGRHRRSSARPAPRRRPLARIPALRPDVAILDVRLPDGEGVSVCREVRSTVDPPPACLMLTSYSDDEALFGAIMAGASGYLLKQVAGIDLVGAVRTVAAGGSLLDPRATAVVLERLRRGDEPERPALRLAEPAGAAHPRPDRRRPDQPPDRRRAVPRREDGQELRLLAAAQARLRPPHRGRRLRRRAPARPALTGHLFRTAQDQDRGTRQRQTRAPGRARSDGARAAALAGPLFEVDAARCAPLPGRCRCRRRRPRPAARRRGPRRSPSTAPPRGGPRC